MIFLSIVDVLSSIEIGEIYVYWLCFSKFAMTLASKDMSYAVFSIP